MDETDVRLTAALDSYPVAPLPAGFARRTMVRIAPPIRFRLQFLDFALPLFFGLLLFVAFTLLWRSQSFLDPLLVSRFKLSLLLMAQRFPRGVPGLTLTLGGALMLILCAVGVMAFRGEGGNQQV